MYLKYFTFENQKEPVKFIETLQVTIGVTCDVYTFPNDANKDLGIIRIKNGCKTPLQKVLQGDKTIEGYLSGSGKLTVKRKNGTAETFAYNMNLKEPKSVNIMIGDTMQWIADSNSLLIAYEICFPPYRDSRYENQED